MKHAPLTHLDEKGEARMVDVGEKVASKRMAIAVCEVWMKTETLQLLESGSVKKGDAFTIAKLAGIQAAKKTSELIPLCHPLALEHIEIRFHLLPIHSYVEVWSEVKTTAKTGVEMEALTGAMGAALALYDMVKSTDPGILITNLRLIRKTGGKSDYSNESRNSNSK